MLYIIEPERNNLILNTDYVIVKLELFVNVSKMHRNRQS